MKRAKCFLCCINWRNAIICLLLVVLAVILLCMLPRWVLCFLVIVLVLSYGFVFYLKS